MPPKISYRASPTLSEFHHDDSLVRGVMGPRGSGKSTGMSWEIWSRANRQKPHQGVRRSRYAVIRNTYVELRDTTLKTWLDWFPEDQCGTFNHHEMAHRIRWNDVECEVLFRALDKPQDIKKVLSLELTGAWVNEAREVPFGLISGLLDAIGRYPRLSEGGPTWHGLMMDTNPPDSDHWWYKLAEERRPENWRFWRQPGGINEVAGKWEPNPAAENINNLIGGYTWYLDRTSGAPPDHVRVYYCGQYGFVKEGRAVYPEYTDALHCPGDVFKPLDGFTIYIGLDFGLTPAAVFAQRISKGRWLWFDELVTEDMGIQSFSSLLKPKLNQYSKFTIEIFGDPAGATRAQTDEKTCYQVLEANGIKASPTESNSFTLRRESVASCLRTLVDGKPRLMISPECKMLRKAMGGGYHFKRIQVSGEEKWHDEPNKNYYSHVAEAAQYAMLGAGEGDVLVKREPIKLRMDDRQHVGRPGGWMF